jgi:hypothetical protein
MSSSSAECTRVTAAMAKNVGIRWCSSCQSDKPAEGFKLVGGGTRRWICGSCAQGRKERSFAHRWGGK